jgi:hypothetical protein
MLHHADACRHEQQRQMLEETVGGIAERDRQRRTRQHQNEQQDHADHRPGKGRSTARTAASPISWQTSRAAIAASMRAPRLGLTRSERAVTLAFSQAATQLLCSKSISP